MTQLLLPPPGLVDPFNPPYARDPVTAAALAEMKPRPGRWESHMTFEGRRAHPMDRRQFAPGSLTTRPLPLPLMALENRTMAHWQARLCGRIDTVQRLEGGVMYGAGTYADTEFGAYVEDLVGQQVLRWVSVDTQPIRYESVSDGEDENGEEWYTLTFLETDLTGLTLVPFPAFARAVIVNEGMDLPSASDAAAASSGIPIQSAAPRPLSLVASGADGLPPAELFADPHFDRPTHVGVRDVPGTAWRQFSGHVADWSVPHIGMRGEVYAPRSRSGYAYFRSGATPAAGPDGVVDIRTGVLSLGGGHADGRLGHREAVAHYDSTSTGVAALAAGEDGHGPWVSGVLRPETTHEQARVMHQSDVSGDWRPIQGAHELVAVLCVNVAGFPVAEPILAAANVVDFPTARFRANYTHAADGGHELGAIVAAGMLHNDPHGNAIRQLRREVAELRMISEPLRGLALESLARKFG